MYIQGIYIFPYLLSTPSKKTEILTHIKEKLYLGHVYKTKWDEVIALHD